jgi:hypothetical protein
MSIENEMPNDIGVIGMSNGEAIKALSRLRTRLFRAMDSYSTRSAQNNVNDEITAVEVCMTLLQRQGAGT